MKQTSKLLSIILCVVLLAGLFTACTTEEAALATAIQNMKKASSYEASTTIASKVDVIRKETAMNGFPTSEVMKLLLSSFRIGMEEKRITDPDTKQQISYAKLNFDALDVLSVRGEYWMETDAAQILRKGIFKIPGYMKMELKREGIDSDYAFIDFTKYQEDIGAAAEKMEALFSHYEKQFRPNITLVKSISELEGAKEYTVAISDSEFKTLLRYVVEDFINNKETRNAWKEYCAAFSQAHSNWNDLYDPLEMEELFDNLETQLPVIKEQAKGLLAAFDTLPVLGKEGITIQYTVTPDGYISKETFVMNLYVDMAAYSTFGDPDAKPQSDGIYNITIEGETLYSNINGPVDAEAPALTEENSSNLFERMQDEKDRAASQRKELQKQSFAGYITEKKLLRTIKNNGMAVSIDGKIQDGLLIHPLIPVSSQQTLLTQLQPGRIHFPLTELTPVLGGEVTWQPETNSVLFQQGGDSYSINLTERTVSVNGEEPQASFGHLFYIYQDKLCMSLGLVESFYSVSIGYDEDANTLLIRTETAPTA